jgi:hypothetical protein
VGKPLGLEGGVMLMMGANSMNTLGPVPNDPLETLEMDDGIVPAVKLMSANIANMVSRIFFL